MNSLFHKLNWGLKLFLYLFKHWFFKWNVDEDGDIVFSIANILHFLKYKEHTLVYFGKKKLTEAPKYLVP